MNDVERHIHTTIDRTLTKADKMDKYLESFSKNVNGEEVREAVARAYGIDLNYISEKNYGSKLPIYNASVMENLRRSLNVETGSTEMDAQIMAMTKNEVMDRYIEIQDFSLTGTELRDLANQIYGTNLTGISALEHSRLSIRSKGQWISKGDNDLFIVSSSLDDVELYVSPTETFEEITGSNQLPEKLTQTLISYGFTYDTDQNRFVYRNSTDESVPDAFKGQVLGAVLETIQTECTN